MDKIFKGEFESIGDPNADLDSSKIYSVRFKIKPVEEGAVRYCTFLGEVIKVVYKQNAWVHDVNWDGKIE